MVLQAIDQTLQMTLDSGKDAAYSGGAMKTYYAYDHKRRVWTLFEMAGGIPLEIDSAGTKDELLEQAARDGITPEHARLY